MVALKAAPAPEDTAAPAREATVDQDLVMELWPLLAATAANNNNHQDMVLQLPHKEATEANRAAVTRVALATKFFTCQ